MQCDNNLDATATAARCLRGIGMCYLLSGNNLFANTGASLLFKQY
jgi:hypothetical protein